MNIQEAIQTLENRLLAERGDASHWRGHLSSSALSTAVAAYALSQVDPDTHRDRIRRAMQWLADHQNADGGWGDTPESPSNMSTTLLTRFALTVADEELRPVAERADDWLKQRLGGSTNSEEIAKGVLDFYGKDLTFSAPILTMGTLSGYIGRETSDPWALVPQLPFEFSVVPAWLYRFLRLQVVSYALPALITVGLIRHREKPSGNTLVRGLRDRFTPRCLKILEAIQPRSGGYLEAAPLTGFVTMCMARAGLSDHPVVQRAVLFLTSTVRDDGSWPIDTDLATWVSTLSVNAGINEHLNVDERKNLLDWLLGQQLHERHPYTKAAPGGWAWTDLSGGVPDADDTSGALLALKRLADDDEQFRDSARRGVEWLLDLQNNDGGIPTFCRGWGKLPFDRSCADLTAHALQAWTAWRDAMPEDLRWRIDGAIRQAHKYLHRRQRPDGSWVPLWFGNQLASGQENPVYGTSQVLRSLAHIEDVDAEMVNKAIDFLIKTQKEEGSWGAESELEATIEETALATSALSEWTDTYENAKAAASRGAGWLLKKIPTDGNLRSAPVGLYFASLWYDERLYPTIFTLRALRDAHAHGVMPE